MSYKRTRNSPILLQALEMLAAAKRPSTACRYDPFGDVLPRREGAIAGITGWCEPEHSLRRMCRQCYADWLPVGEATAHHMVKRLYEQLTGELDARAAISAALHREYTLGSTAWNKVETVNSGRDGYRYDAVEGRVG